MHLIAECQRYFGFKLPNELIDKRKLNMYIIIIIIVYFFNYMLIMCVTLCCYCIMSMMMIVPKAY